MVQSSTVQFLFDRTREQTSSGASIPALAPGADCVSRAAVSCAVSYRIHGVVGRAEAAATESQPYRPADSTQTDGRGPDRAAPVPDTSRVHTRGHGVHTVRGTEEMPW